MNIYQDVVVARPKPAKAAPKAKAGMEIAILRRKELGNNCKFIANAYPGMGIFQADDMPGDVKHIIRWGTTTNLPARIGADKRVIINEAKAIHQTSDKGKFRIYLADNNLAPRSWMSLDELQREEEVAEAVIVRPMVHERSVGVHFCKTLADLKAAIAKYPGGYYISEYIKKEREVRVFVVSGKALMVFEKKPKNKNDVSWGCVEEGALDYIRWSQWPLKAVEVAIKSFNLSKLDFGAVDVIIKGDKAYALEINTAPEVWPYYGERLADAFKYIVKNGKDRLNVKNYGDWHEMLHPCLS